MACTAAQLLALARQEIGVREDSNGIVKYNVAYYGRAVRGSIYPWCCTLVWWLFQEVGAPSLYYGGEKTAYCPTLLAFHHDSHRSIGGLDNLQNAAQRTDLMDILFLNFRGASTAAHVGVCEEYAGGNSITLIEGNTGRLSNTAGGQVLRRRRPIKYVVGAYRPQYEEEIDLTEEQVRRIVRDELEAVENEMAMQPASAWSKMAEAKALGYTDGSRPGSYATREEVATMLVNANS